MPDAAKLHCSFCLKSQDEVAQLLAGPGGVCICDDCVDICNGYLDGRTPDPSRLSPPASELPTERLLGQLPAIDATARGKASQLEWAVDELRTRKVSWARIGEALGVSRQSAWERFS